MDKKPVMCDSAARPLINFAEDAQETLSGWKSARRHARLPREFVMWIARSSILVSIDYMCLETWRSWTMLTSHLS